MPTTNSQAESRMVVPREWGGGGRGGGERSGELVFNGHRVSVWEDENILEVHGDSYEQCKHYLMPLNTINTG